MAGASLEQHVGERGIGVQISGDGNTVAVYAGRAELSLARKHLRKAEPKTELQLLRVDLRATTLVGRDAEQSALQDWLASDRRVSVRCVTGRAGSGKTRLAIELCDLTVKAGWTAGFVQHRQFSEFIKYAGEWRWRNDTLVVVDYAAALARDLRAWLEILAQPEAQSGGGNLRLLLLERHAERDLGWWAELLRPVSLPMPRQMNWPIRANPCRCRASGPWKTAAPCSPRRCGWRQRSPGFSRFHTRRHPTATPISTAGLLTIRSTTNRCT